MFKRLVLLLFAWQISLCAAAQQLPDTLLLKEVVVWGIPEQKFATGSKIIQYDSIDLAGQQGRPLSDLLMRKSPLYFKEYGPGMLSTVSFRGTSANHTAVLWNGLNLNQPNLGQTDFSLVPLFAVEDISVQFGGSSALYGSDAIGGSIYLKSTPKWEDQLNLNLRQEAGSFGRYFTGIAASAGLGNWALSSKVYRQQADNDFEYVNTSKKDRPLERNRNAAFKQTGLVQNVAYRFSGRSQLAFKSWYQHTQRQIQPTLGDRNTKDQQEDEHLNLSLQYRNISSLGFFDVQLGHLYNYLLYNLASEYKTWQTIGNFRYEKELHEKLHLQAGAKLNHVEADIEQYAAGGASENRTDLFASFRYQPFPGLEASLNLRQAFVSGYTVPFTPSAGLELNLLRTETSSLSWMASGGRSYRVPTLNERYWKPGGRPDIRPENSWNIESSLKSLFRQDRSSLELSLTAYHMWVDNWILWIPDNNGIWRPENIQEVLSRGLEFSAGASHLFSFGTLEAGGNLGYTRSINQKATDPYDRTVGKQLAFVPELKSNAYLSYLYRNWNLSGNWSYTSTRYTTGEEEADYSIPAFNLLDVSLGRRFNIRKHTFGLNLAVRNLLNRQYQNYDDRAMPGRNYNFTVKYFFNHTFK